MTGVWDAATQQALERWVGTENFEERLLAGPRLDWAVLQYLRDKAPGRE